jgi:hypothetical protein
MAFQLTGNLVTTSGIKIKQAFLRLRIMFSPDESMLSIKYLFYFDPEKTESITLEGIPNGINKELTSSEYKSMTVESIHTIVKDALESSLGKSKVKIILNN